MLASITGLFGCATTPMVLEPVFDSGAAQPFRKVLVVGSGLAFPETSRTSFFNPSVEAIRKMLVDQGVSASTMLAVNNDPAFKNSVLGNAKLLEASHVLSVVASSVSSWGPRNSTTEYQKQLRLVGKFTYTFIIYDVQKQKNVWEAKLQSGSEGVSDEATAVLIRDKLQEQLLKAGYLRAAMKQP